MKADIVSRTAKGHARKLILMRRRRQRQNSLGRPDRPPRRSLSARDREAILKKTGGRCHICGGRIKGPWQADHVLAYSAGGEHAEDNYLPAHALCNHYRWDYVPEEFQQILKLGVWLRTQIEKRTAVGQLAGAAFVAYEKRRIGRKK